MKNSTISNLILCAMMGLIVFIFVLFISNFSIYGIAYSIFMMFIYVHLVFARREKKAKYRRIFQSVFADLFCIAFISNLFNERGSMAITAVAFSNAEIPFCHIAIPQVLVPLLVTGKIIFPAQLTDYYASVGSMIVIWLAVALTIGRGWCSWVCFYGGWEEGFSSIGKKRRLNLFSKNKEIREFQLGFFSSLSLVH